MNKKLISKCNTLMTYSNNNKVFKDELVYSINNNADLANKPHYVDEAIEYITSKGYKVVEKKDPIVKFNSNKKDKQPPIVKAKRVSSEIINKSTEKSTENNNIIEEDNEVMDDDIIDEELLEDSEINDMSYENDQSVPALAQYISDLQNIDTTLLTSDQEKKLCKKAQKGDIKARNIMIEHNLKLVIATAKYYSSLFNDNFTFEDAIQYGNIGLMTAISKYDTNSDYRFSTYAIHWIRQAIRRGMSNNGRTIRLPVHLIEIVSHINKELDFLKKRDYTDEVLPSYYQEIADRINDSGWRPNNRLSGFTAEDIKHYLKILQTRTPASLDIIIGEDDCDYLINFITDDKAENEAFESIASKELHRQLEEILHRYLDERSIEILKLRNGYYGKCYTLSEIGQKYGVCRERIRQLESLAYKKICKMSKASHLRDYLYS